MTIKTIFATLATATAMTGFATAPAHAEIKTLGECYDAVLTWCNETFPDMDCSQSSGLDQCDEVFGDKSNQGKVFKMILPGPGGTKTVSLLVPAVQKARAFDRDDARPARVTRERRDRGGLRTIDPGERRPLDPPSGSSMPRPSAPSPAASIDLSPKVPGS